MTVPRPKFRKPPLIEVGLAIQFEPLPDLRTPQMALFWSRIREQFPQARELQPLPHFVESFEPGARPVPRVLSVQQIGAARPSRMWFQNASGSQAVQLQQDRLMFNWRKVEEGEYPHFEPIREAFRGVLDAFVGYLADENLGEIIPDQAEVVYIDRLLASEGWERPGQLERIVTVWSPRYSDAFLSEPEDARLSVRYVIKDAAGQPVGRLNLSVDPVSATEARPAIFLRTTARGRPVGDGIEGALRFHEIGHEWAARAFASFTTDHMHGVWERVSNDT